MHATKEVTVEMEEGQEQDSSLNEWVGVCDALNIWVTGKTLSELREKAVFEIDRQVAVGKASHKLDYRFRITRNGNPCSEQVVSPSRGLAEDRHWKVNPHAAITHRPRE